jgi:hypothetical protein
VSDGDQYKRKAHLSAWANGVSQQILTEARLDGAVGGRASSQIAGEGAPSGLAFLFVNWVACPASVNAGIDLIPRAMLAATSGMSSQAGDQNARPKASLIFLPSIFLPSSRPDPRDVRASQPDTPEMGKCPVHDAFCIATSSLPGNYNYFAVTPKTMIQSTKKVR